MAIPKACVYAAEPLVFLAWLLLNRRVLVRHVPVILAAAGAPLRAAGVSRAGET